MKLYNVCKPEESLAPDDPRNIQLDDFGGPGQRPRGVLWAERLARQIEFADAPIFMLFTGLPGSGKTTELRRLLSLLAREDGAHLLPVRVDAELLIDISSPVDVPDLIAPMIHEVEQAVLEAEGRDPTQVEGRQLSVPGSNALVAELRTRPSFRRQVRAIVATHLDEFLRDARATLEQLCARPPTCACPSTRSTRSPSRSQSGETWT